MNFKNKKIIITGATGGIGYSLVKKFYEHEAVILATGTNEDKLKKLKDEFKNIQTEKFKLDNHPKIESFIFAITDLESPLTPHISAGFQLSFFLIFKGLIRVIIYSIKPPV